MNKRILLLGNHSLVIYNFRKELIKKLLSEGFQVYISLPNDNEKVPEMISWGCRFIETNLDRRGKNPFKDLKLLYRYIKIIKNVKPNFVLAFTVKPNIYGSIVCSLCKIPYINNITGLGSGFNSNKILKKILIIQYKFSLKNSNCVFFQNKFDMQLFLDNKIVNGYYQLIPGSGVNLVEYKYKKYPPENPITFLFIGRIMKDKGIDQYLEASKIIKDKYPNTKFNIVGFVEKTQPHYKQLIHDYQNKGYVNFYGYQKNVKPFIEESHCLIQPSHGGEGISNVLLEAGATGRALIASDIPGCRETIKEGKNGFLFEPCNTKGLAQNIEKFINLSYEEKTQFGEYSRVKVENEFDRNIIINAYMNRINNSECTK